MARIPVTIQAYYETDIGDVIVDQDSLAVAGLAAMQSEAGYQQQVVHHHPQHFQHAQHYQHPHQYQPHYQGHPHNMPVHYNPGPEFNGRGSFPGVNNKKKVPVRSGFLGLGNTSVTASSDGTLAAVAQEPLMLSNLTTDGDTGDFTITDIKVGSKSIFSGTEAVPAGRFRPDATGKMLKFRKPMFVGQTVTIFITNNNTGATKSLSANFDTIERAN